jgi:hypothetical protein
MKTYKMIGVDQMAQHDLWRAGFSTKTNRPLIRENWLWLIRTCLHIENE